MFVLSRKYGDTPDNSRSEAGDGRSNKRDQQHGRPETRSSVTRAHTFLPQGSWIDKLQLRIRKKASDCLNWCCSAVSPRSSIQNFLLLLFFFFFSCSPIRVWASVTHSLLRKAAFKKTGMKVIESYWVIENIRRKKESLYGYLFRCWDAVINTCKNWCPYTTSASKILSYSGVNVIIYIFARCFSYWRISVV